MEMSQKDKPKVLWVQWQDEGVITFTPMTFAYRDVVNAEDVYLPPRDEENNPLRVYIRDCDQ